MCTLWVEEEVCGAWEGTLQGIPGHVQVPTFSVTQSSDKTMHVSWLCNILQEWRGEAICGAALALDVSPRAAAVMLALCLTPTRFIRPSFCTIRRCISQTAIYRHANRWNLPVRFSSILSYNGAVVLVRL